MSNMAQRVIVAVFAIPVLVYVTYLGGFFFYLFVLLASSIALLEFYSLCERKEIFPMKILGSVTGSLVVTVFFYEELFNMIVPLLQRTFAGVRLPSQLQWLLIVFVVFVIVSLLLELSRSRGSAVSNLSATVFGVAYVSLSFGTLLGVRELFLNDFPLPRFLAVVSTSSPESERELIYQWGGFTVISILACIWICDTAAQFVGLRFGRHKLSPRISPNKTWEGAISGFVAALLTAMAAKSLVLPFLTLGETLVIGFVVGVFGQVGDLAESLLKRDAGVKDSSGIIPGHGGVLDRFDSLLFVSPILFLYFDFFLF